MGLGALKGACDNLETASVSYQLLQNALCRTITVEMGIHLRSPGARLINNVTTIPRISVRHHFAITLRSISRVSYQTCHNLEHRTTDRDIVLGT